MILYDASLRIVMAGGELLRSAGYVPDHVQGQLLSDVLPAEAFAILEPRYRQALAGVELDQDYRSPVDGKL